MRKHQRGAARAIHLFAVVRLDDLHVKIGTERRGGELNQFNLQIHAQRHVAGLEHRYLIRGGTDELELAFAKAGCADDGWDLFL